ncbi:hypothetical protein QYE76_032697 [Lolium multiflorum]|uniref:Uncharacterized protein n=1 Tax=Lolium multiflorum TaxID=4521 RepID=A0AAD8QW01_LOLMU|nr:hypothetical protein QYE76_032697 [Lolium multiflorum]
MEQACSADSYEVTSQEGITGQASVEMFFSSLQAHLKARATEAAANVAEVEEASKLKPPRSRSWSRAQLRAARDQCAVSEEAGRSAARRKLKLADRADAAAPAGAEPP